MGMTHIRLAEADEESLHGALHAAWKLRIEKNRKSGGKASASKNNLAAATSARRK
jgi:hypothetical protein